MVQVGTLLSRRPFVHCSNALSFPLVLCNRAGIGTEDSALADWLRRTVDTPVLLAANKCERRGAGVSGALQC